MKMDTAKAVLILVGVIFVGFGLAFLAVPARLMLDVGIVLDQAAARIEIRAVYGGMNLGLGLVLLYLGRTADTVRPALRLAAAILGTIALARTLGILMAGQIGSPLMLVFLGMEAGGAAICGWAARARRSSSAA